MTTFDVAPASKIVKAAIIILYPFENPGLITVPNNLPVVASSWLLVSI